MAPAPLVLVAVGVMARVALLVPLEAVSVMGEVALLAPEPVAKDAAVERPLQRHAADTNIDVNQSGKTLAGESLLSGLSPLGKHAANTGPKHCTAGL
jgi:hypothetical protein